MRFSRDQAKRGSIVYSSLRCSVSYVFAVHSVSSVASGAMRDARPAYFRSLAEAIRSPVELIEQLGLPRNLLESSGRATDAFPVLVPRSFLDRMRPGDPDDPLLRQVLPLRAENDSPPGVTHDAVGDLQARTAPGLIHKYHGRALLIAAGACAIHCRYCFRRHYPYQDDPRRLDDWAPALAAIENDPTLTEIILSGGDPLMLTDPRLSELVSRLEEIPHLRRLRIHTRLPIVLPDRVTPELLYLLRTTRLAVAVVVHANHPSELVGDCADALNALTSEFSCPGHEPPSKALGDQWTSPAPGTAAGGILRRVTVLNQAVLLRGVNDDADTLTDLSERLFELGVLPYYLHQLDRIAGAAHFEVPEAMGRAIVEELHRRLPGYLVPRYVREIPGEWGKTAMS